MYIFFLRLKIFIFFNMRSILSISLAFWSLLGSDFFHLDLLSETHCMDEQKKTLYRGAAEIESTKDVSSKVFWREVDKGTTFSNLCDPKKNGLVEEEIAGNGLKKVVTSQSSIHSVERFAGKALIAGFVDPDDVSNSGRLKSHLANAALDTLHKETESKKSSTVCVQTVTTLEKCFMDAKSYKK